MLTCSSCSHENNAIAKFCEECGTLLEAAQVPEAAPVREERKVITALFCDLVGSTALGERLDAEDISRLLRDYQQICRARIESHGGVIEKFIGDAVVGVFGVPLSHEDDPERAVRAALRIIEDLEASDLDIQVRIGVNTGEALVRLDTDPRLGEGFATGDAMNTAARIEAAAPVMGVAVGALTLQASQGAIVYEELEAISAKGKAEPVPVWRALRPLSRIGTEERDRTLFLGRDLELSMLTQLSARSRTRPSTEFVTIIAEAGLGKSRLVRELARHVDSLPELVTWREGRCLPYGDGISFWALGEIIKAQAGILETDDQQEVSNKLDGAITEPDAQTKSWIKDRLAPLVGLETDTEAPQREEAFTAWRRFLEQMASSGPTVLVIEDLHWADAAFVAFLEHLSERTAGLPLLVIVAARPEVEERHPSWPPGRRSTVLSLSPLTDEDLEALITTSLPEADPELIDIVLERAGGSPLYAEQLAAMLRERALPIAGGALDEAMIPSSVQALIAARIDALPPEPKRVLMQASVIGKTFWAGALASLDEHEDLEATLGELVRREFCRRVHPSSMEGDAEFGFWHALVRDVAYAELTRAERAKMHAGVARWIAGRTSGAMGEDAEIVVHHLDSALEFAPSAPGLDTGGITELLTDALIAAGEAAMRTEMPRAIPYLERALGLIPVDDRRRTEVLRSLGLANSVTGTPGAAVKQFEELVALHQAEGDEEAEVGAAINLSDVLWAMGEGARGLALLAEIKDRLGTAPSLSRAKLLAEESGTMGVAHDNEAAARLAGESIVMAEVLGIDPPPKALLSRGISRVALGDLAGEEDVRLAAERYLQVGDAAGATEAIFSLGATMSDQGPLGGIPFHEEAIELAERFGMARLVWVGRAGRLQALVTLGRFDEVLEESGPILEWAAAHDDAFSRFVVLFSLAVVEGERGEGAVGPEELADLARRLGAKSALLWASRLAFASGDDDLARTFVLEGAPHAGLVDAFFVARVSVQADLPELAAELLSRALVHYPAEEAAVLGAKATLAEAKGEHAPAREDYARAAEIFGELGIAPDQAYALHGLGRCLLALGETQEGVARLQEARALWEEMKAVPRIAEIDELIARIS